MLNPNTFYTLTSSYLVLPRVHLCRVDDWVSSKIKFVNPIPNGVKLSFLLFSVFLDGCITCSFGLKKNIYAEVFRVLGNAKEIWIEVGVIGL